MYESLHVAVKIANKLQFLTRDATQSAVMRLYVVRPSVRLSVRLSVRDVEVCFHSLA